MKTKELVKALSEKGLTPEQVIKIVNRYEKQKEKIKQYQKEKYYKVTISVSKKEVQELSNATGIPENMVKKYLAGLKAISSVPEEAIKKLKDFNDSRNRSLAL